MDERPTARRAPRAARGWRTSIVALAALLAVLVPVAATYPGMVRLVLLQPARDLMFFARELQPLRQRGEIERVNPAPTATVVLPGAGEGSVDVAVDFWLPERNPAPVALLLHGSSPRGRMLGFNRLLAARLQTEGWLVAAPDLRGFGDSGKPNDRSDPLLWRYEQDILLVAEYALAHPRSDGRIVAVGHSLGGSAVLSAGSQEHPFAAIVAIGPSRDSEEEEPSLWRRMRFAGDRRMGRLVALPVARDAQWRYAVPHLVVELSSRPPVAPVLLMDGEREGDTLIGMLRDAADTLGDAAAHVTIPDAHHYCGAYQLPLSSTVYVRTAVFDRCAAAVVAFLSSVAR